MSLTNSTLYTVDGEILLLKEITINMYGNDVYTFEKLTDAKFIHPGLIKEMPIEEIKKVDEKEWMKIVSPDT